MHIFTYCSNIVQQDIKIFIIIPVEGYYILTIFYLKTYINNNNINIIHVFTTI